jgi:hypothetical protein
VYVDDFYAFGGKDVRRKEVMKIAKIKNETDVIQVRLFMT